MANAPLFFNNISFAWWDSRLINYYEVRGVGESGEVYTLHPRFYAPYDMLLQQSRFYYLFPHKVLAGTYGTGQSFELMKELQTATAEDVLRLRERYGHPSYNQQWSEHFVDFLGRSTANASRRGSKSVPPLTLLAPPFHFQSSVPPDAYDFDEPLVAVRVEFVEFLYEGDEIRELTRDQVLTLALTGFEPIRPDS